MLRIYITPDDHELYLLSFERTHISVGAGADNDVRLKGKGVSGRHFRLRCEGSGVVLEDAGSRNGTYVNGCRVNGSQVVVSTDEIRIVGHRVRVVSTEAEVVAGAAGEALAGVKTTATGRGAGAETEAAGIEASPAEALADAEQEPPPGFDAPRVAAIVGARARAFQERADAAHLLRGEELHEAWTWVHCGARVTPVADRRARELVVRSRAAARKRLRRGLGAVTVCVVALMAGGWTAGVVLAGGPEAHMGWLDQRLREFAVEAELKKREDCLRTSARQAEAARADAKASPEAALRQATDGLACLTKFPELRDTPAEEVVRTLLAMAHGQVVARGTGITRVAMDPRGARVAWAGEGEGLTVWDVARTSRRSAGGTGATRLLSISDNGERMVVLGGGQVQQWNLLDAESAPRRLTLAGRAGETGVAAVSGDGRVLAADAGGELRVFHLDRPETTLGGLVLAGLPGVASAVVVNADGTRVFAATGAEVMGWRVSSRKAERPTKHGGHAALVTALALARCGEDQRERWLLSGDIGGVVHANSLGGGAKTRPVVLTADDPITAMGMTPDCRRVVAATVRNVQAWDLHALEPARTRQMLPVGGPITGLSFDGAAGERVVVATGNRLAICDLSSSALCAERTGHTQAVTTMAVAPGAGRAISAGADGVRLWDIRGTPGVGSLQAHGQAPVRALAVGEDGRVLSANGADATLWRLTGVGAPTAVAALVGATGQALRAVALSPNPSWAATAPDESSLVVWRLGADGATASPRVVATAGRMSRLAFSDDGAWLVGVGADATCAVEVRGAGQFVCQPLPSSGELQALAFLPATHKLAVGGADRGVVVHDLDAVFKGHGASSQDLGKGTGVIRVLATSPDGRWLAGGGEHANARLWDMRAQPAAVNTLVGVSETIEALVFSPDGHWLVAAAGRKIYAWGLGAVAPAPTRVSEDLAATVRALTFGSDGTLLSGGADGKLLAWKLEQSQLTPREIGTQHGMITQLALLSDGEFVVSAGNESSTLHFWPLTVRPLLEMAKQVLGPGAP